MFCLIQHSRPQSFRIEYFLHDNPHIKLFFAIFHKIMKPLILFPAQLNSKLLKSKVNQVNEISQDVELIRVKRVILVEIERILENLHLVR
jgi:hypothetical protein